MSAIAPKPASLIGHWLAHHADCRPPGPIMADARAGRIPGIEPAIFDFLATDEQAVLAVILETQGNGRSNFG